MIKEKFQNRFRWFKYVWLSGISKFALIRLKTKVQNDENYRSCGVLRIFRVFSYVSEVMINVRLSFNLVLFFNVSKWALIFRVKYDFPGTRFGLSETLGRFWIQGDSQRKDDKMGRRHTQFWSRLLLPPRHFAVWGEQQDNMDRKWRQAQIRYRIFPVSLSWCNSHS